MSLTRIMQPCTNTTYFHTANAVDSRSIFSDLVNNIVWCHSSFNYHEIVDRFVYAILTNRAIEHVPQFNRLLCCFWHHPPIIVLHTFLSNRAVQHVAVDYHFFDFIRCYSYCLN